MTQVMSNEITIGSFSFLNDDELISVDGGGWFSDFCKAAAYVCAVAACFNPATATVFAICAIGYDVCSTIADRAGMP